MDYIIDDFYLIGHSSLTEHDADLLAEYKFNAEGSDSASLERVNRQVDLLPLRADEANILQSLTGEIKTFDANVAAFDVTVGLVTQGEATTQIPTDMSIWDDSANVDVSYDSLTLVNTLTANASVTNHRMFTGSATVTGEKYISSCLIKKGGYRYVQFTGSSGFDTSDVINFDLQEGLVNEKSGTITGYIEDHGDQWLIVSIATATSNQSVGRIIFAYSGDLDNGRLPALDIGGAILEISYYNFVQSAFASSPIDNPTGATPTRAADSNRIATLTETGVWVAPDVVSGDFNNGSGDGNFINGVRKSPFSLTFGGGQPGTFTGLVTLAWISARLRCTSNCIVRVASESGGNQINLEMVTGDIDEALAMLRSSTFTIDFLTSDYDTGSFAADTAILTTLLDDAGYDVGSIPAATQWPVNNFELEFNFEYLGEDDGFPRIFDAVLDSDNRITVFFAGNNLQTVISILEIDNNSYSVTANLNIDRSFGDSFIVKISLTANEGFTIVAENVTKGVSGTDNKPSPVSGMNGWKNLATLFNIGAGSLGVNTKCGTITLKTLGGA